MPERTTFQAPRARLHTELNADDWMTSKLALGTG